MPSWFGRKTAEELATEEAKKQHEARMADIEKKHTVQSGEYLTDAKRDQVHALRDQRVAAEQARIREEAAKRIAAAEKKGAKPFDSLFKPGVQHPKPAKYLTDEKRAQIRQDQRARHEKAIDEAIAKNPKEKFVASYANDNFSNPGRRSELTSFFEKRNEKQESQDVIMDTSSMMRP